MFCCTIRRARRQPYSRHSSWICWRSAHTSRLSRSTPDTVARRTGLPADGVTQRLYGIGGRGLLVGPAAGLMARARDRCGRRNAECDTDARPCRGDHQRPPGQPRHLPPVVPGALWRGARAHRVRRLRRRGHSRGKPARCYGSAAGGGSCMPARTRSGRLVTELAARSGVELDVVRAAVSEVTMDTLAYRLGDRNAALLDAAGACSANRG